MHYLVILTNMAATELLPYVSTGVMSLGLILVSKIFIGPDKVR